MWCADTYSSSLGSNSSSYTYSLPLPRGFLCSCTTLNVRAARGGGGVVACVLALFAEEEEEEDAPSERSHLLMGVVVAGEWCLLCAFFGLLFLFLPLPSVVGGGGVVALCLPLSFLVVVVAGSSACDKSASMSSISMST